MIANKDIRIDAYIEKSNKFAQPILNHLRLLIHKACPELEECIKWGMPAFYYKGPMCNLASFKSHAVFGFWKASLIHDPQNYLRERSNKGGEAMGNFGRITSIDDLPPDTVILDFISQAKKLNDDNIKLPPRIKSDKSESDLPSDLIEALATNKNSECNFLKLSAGHRREYIEWILEAKTEVTKHKRLANAIEWLAEGKSRNWKYSKK